MNGSSMGGIAAIAGTAHAREPFLQRMANQMFRCSHRHKSHALTPRGETERYSVCLDCGARLLPNAPALPADASVPRIHRAVLHLALVALVLVGGFVVWVSHSPTRIGRAGGQTASLVAPGGAAHFSAGPITGTGRAAAMLASSGNPEHSAAAPVDPNPRAASPARGVHSALRLESKGSIVVLGRDAASSLELSEHPAALSSLIQTGALFAVSRGTAIKICQRKERVSQVQILEGSRSGQQGWVPTWQIATP